MDKVQAGIVNLCHSYIKSHSISSVPWFRVANGDTWRSEGCHMVPWCLPDLPDRQVEAEGELELPESKVRFSETVPGAWPVSRKQLPGDDRFPKMCRN